MSAPRSPARRLLANARSAGRRAEQSIGFGTPEAASDPVASNASIGQSEPLGDRTARPAREAGWSGIPQSRSTRH